LHLIEADIHVERLNLFVFFESRGRLLKAKIHVQRLVADDHNRLALLFDAGQHVLDCFRANRQLVRETVVADEVTMAADLGFRNEEDRGFMDRGLFLDS
jgi:hypothetical protein